MAIQFEGFRTFGWKSDSDNPFSYEPLGTILRVGGYDMRDELTKREP